MKEKREKERRREKVGNWVLLGVNEVDKEIEERASVIWFFFFLFFFITSTKNQDKLEQ